MDPPCMDEPNNLIQAGGDLLSYLPRLSSSSLTIFLHPSMNVYDFYPVNITQDNL